MDDKSIQLSYCCGKKPSEEVINNGSTFRAVCEFCGKCHTADSMKKLAEIWDNDHKPLSKKARSAQRLRSH